MITRFPQPIVAGDGADTARSPELCRDGFEIVPRMIPHDLASRLVAATASDRVAASAGEDQKVREKAGRVYAVRNLMSAVPAVAELAACPAVRRCVEPVLGSGAFPVRALLFDKTPGANWKVAWHQDLSVAICERVN